MCSFCFPPAAPGTITTNAANAMRPLRLVSYAKSVGNATIALEDIPIDPDDMDQA